MEGGLIIALKWMTVLFLCAKSKNLSPYIKDAQIRVSAWDPDQNKRAPVHFSPFLFSPSLPPGHPNSPLNKVTLTMITISTCVIAIVYATQDSCPLTVKVTLHVPEHFVADGKRNSFIRPWGNNWTECPPTTTTPQKRKKKNSNTYSALYQRYLLHSFVLLWFFRHVYLIETAQFEKHVFIFLS